MIKIFIFCSTLFIICFSCETRKSEAAALYKYNIYSDYRIIQLKDSISQVTEKYCFEISHEKNIDLNAYYLVINLDGSIVFSDFFQSRVLFSWQKKTGLNRLAILIYDKKKGTVFNWSNKDVYDFKDYRAKCYKIVLYSEQNIDHSEGIKMAIK